MLPSVHLTSSPAGDNNGVSKALPRLNVARFLSGWFHCARTAQSPNNWGFFFCFPSCSAGHNSYKDTKVAAAAGKSLQCVCWECEASIRRLKAFAMVLRWGVLLVTEVLSCFLIRLYRGRGSCRCSRRWAAAMQAFASRGFCARRKEREANTWLVRW